jgi:hypothetical protein
MSDILEKLLGVEKDASVLVSGAEGEAARRRAAALSEAQARHAEVLRRAAVDAAARVESEKARIAAERDAKNRAYSQELASRPRDREALRRVVVDFVDTGLQ